jgi:hypothetical protein
MSKPVRSTQEEKISTFGPRLSVLEERSNWHRNVGWGVASFLAAALLALVTWWIPRELNTARDSIKADVSSQLEPMKIDMARISALLELKETKNVSEAIRRGVDFSKPKYAFVVVRAIAEQAKSDGILTKPEALIEVNDQIKRTVANSPELLSEAWAAQLALVDYRSSLLVNSQATKNASPELGFSGITVNGGTVTNGNQKLDGYHWRNVTFINSHISYNGGPLFVDNVLFINCTFTMSYSVPADRFAGMLLAQEAVSGVVSKAS